MPEEAQDTPVLDTIAAMTAVSVAECELAPDALLLVRLAALAAVDAGPASYLLHIGPAAEAGITIEDGAERSRGCGPDHRDGPGHFSRDQHRRGTGIGHCDNRGRFVANSPLRAQRRTRRLAFRLPRAGRPTIQRWSFGKISSFAPHSGAGTPGSTQAQAGQGDRDAFR